MSEEVLELVKDRDKPEHEGVMAVSKLKVMDDLSKIFFDLVEENGDLARAV